MILHAKVIKVQDDLAICRHCTSVLGSCGSEVAILCGSKAIWTVSECYDSSHIFAHAETRKTNAAPEHVTNAAPELQFNFVVAVCGTYHQSYSCQTTSLIDSSWRL